MNRPIPNPDPQPHHLTAYDLWRSASDAERAALQHAYHTLYPNIAAACPITIGVSLAALHMALAALRYTPDAAPASPPSDSPESFPRPMGVSPP